MTRALSEMRPVPRRGLSRDEAAMYIGISAAKFDELEIARGADQRADFISQNALRNSGARIVLRDGDDVGSRSV
jgi:hypothetical protein